MWTDRQKLYKSGQTKTLEISYMDRQNFRNVDRQNFQKSGQTKTLECGQSKSLEI